MGRGKGWTNEESVHLAEAWIEASEDHGQRDIKGTDQDTDDFWKKIRSIFVSKSPAEPPQGTYSQRGVKAMQNQWSANISRDVKKFNKSLLLVNRSEPSGCNEQNKIINTV